MKPNSKPGGSMLILLIPLGLMLFLALLFVADSGRAHYAAHRAQTLADLCLLSSLNLRIEGLTRVAERWTEFGPALEVQDGNLVVTQGNLAQLQNQARTLSRALSGYKGRIKGVIKVAAEANGFDRERITLKESAALDLGLEPGSHEVSDLLGQSALVDGVFYQRTWNLEERLGSPEERAQFEVEFLLPRLWQWGEEKRKFWALRRDSAGSLRWDWDFGNPSIQAAGNGGFPRDWGDVLWQGRVDPHRYPVFRVEGRPGS